VTRYRTIVADPPWPMPKGGSYTAKRGHERWRRNMDGKRPSDLPYQEMTLDAIKGLRVAEIAEDGAHLYLWVPNAFREHGHAVVRAWGFVPSTVLVWAKTPRGIGLGGAFTCTTEFVLFARRGMLPASERIDSTWWNWTRPHNRHSAKPDAFLDVVERVSPGPYVEMFARRNRLGWDTWGNEALEHVDLEAA
jgi:N6-adenosine-specific RNA methylase IME4